MNKLQLLNGVDFKVSTKPVLVDVDGKSFTIPDRFATYRMDTGEPLGVVGSRYKVQQHSDNLTLVDNSIAKISNDYDIKHTVENARIYSRFTLNDFNVLSGNNREQSKMAIDIINSYDGSRSFQLAISMWRQVCSNGMFGFAVEHVMKQMHVKGVNLNNHLEGIETMIQAYKVSYEKMYNVLQDKPVIGKEKIEDSFSKNLVKEASNSYPIEYNRIGKHTAWVQYNSFTHAVTHMKAQESHKQELSKQVSQLFLNHYMITG